MPSHHVSFGTFPQSALLVEQALVTAWVMCLDISLPFVFEAMRQRIFESFKIFFSVLTKSNFNLIGFGEEIFSQESSRQCNFYVASTFSDKIITFGFASCIEQLQWSIRRPFSKSDTGVSSWTHVYLPSQYRQSLCVETRMDYE
ncbi:MAG: hypothetical protein ACX936_21480 [Marinobacter sp.]